MFKTLGSVLCVVAALAASFVTPVSAQVIQATADRRHIGASWSDLDAPRLLSSAQTPQPAGKKKGGRKLMWITLAASVAAVGVAAALAPEASIPTAPSGRSGGCTNFYRPGTLMTTSGYRCTSR